MYVTLSDERRAYVDQAKIEKTRAERIAAGFLVEDWLHKNGYGGKIYRSKIGKPLYLKTAGEVPLFFSVSHSYPYVAAAFSDLPVGIDVEAFGQRKTSYIDNLMGSRFFTSGEKQLICGAAAKQMPSAQGSVPTVSEKERMFFLIWTFKEAICKALELPLDEVLSAYDYAAYMGNKNLYPRLAFRQWEEEMCVVTTCIKEEE